MKLMVERKFIINNLKNIVNTKIVEMTSNDALGLIIRPFINAAANKYICKVDTFLKFIEDDKTGMIDIKSILNEMMNNLITAKAKEYPNISKGLVIGDGKIKMDIPLFVFLIVLDTKDIEEFKNSFKQ